MSRYFHGNSSLELMLLCGWNNHVNGFCNDKVPVTEKVHSYSLVSFSGNSELADTRERQMKLCRQGLNNCETFGHYLYAATFYIVDDVSVPH